MILAVIGAVLNLLLHLAGQKAASAAFLAMENSSDGPR